MKIKIFITIFLFIFLFYNLGHAQEEAKLYSQAVKAAKSGNFIFAFMYFRSLLANYPDSKYREGALFAQGEYYFLIADYNDAGSTFIKFINNYLGSKARIFALAYLFKIAENKKNSSLAKKIKNEIITFQRLSFLFSNYKEFKYRSLFLKKYRALYYIDKVEFYAGGELFAQIPY